MCVCTFYRGIVNKFKKYIFSVILKGLFFSLLLKLI